MRGRQGRVRQAAVQETSRPEEEQTDGKMERKEEGNLFRGRNDPPFIDGADPPRLMELPTIEEDCLSITDPARGGGGR